jgi:hypothetical protein
MRSSASAAARTAAAALFVTAALIRGAAAAPVQYRFSATWTGLPVADIYLTLDDDADGYRAAIDIRSLGLMKLLSRFDASGSAEGAFAADATIVPARYDSDYKLRKKRNHQSLVYVPDGSGVTAERGPADTSTKPPLALPFRQNVVDPLAALVALRDRLRRHALPVDGSFKIPVYDDKRRFDIDGKFLGRETLSLNGTANPALHFHLLLTPIAGFRTAAEEGEDIENKPREVELYISDDARLVPLQLTVSIFYLPAVTLLVGPCTTAAPCTVAPF